MEWGSDGVMEWGSDGVFGVPPDTLASLQSCSIFDRGWPKRDGKTRTSTIEGGFASTDTTSSQARGRVEHFPF
jgi:hypothetical protein